MKTETLQELDPAYPELSIDTDETRHRAIMPVYHLNLFQRLVVSVSQTHNANFFVTVLSGAEERSQPGSFLFFTTPANLVLIFPVRLRVT